MLSLDVAVAGSVLPMTEVLVVERVLEKRDHPPLGLDFPLADGAHASIPLALKELT